MKKYDHQHPVVWDLRSNGWREDGVGRRMEEANPFFGGKVLGYLGWRLAVWSPILDTVSSPTCESTYISKTMLLRGKSQVVAARGSVMIFPYLFQSIQ